MKKVTVFALLVIFLSQPTAFAQTTQQELDALTIEITLLKRLIVEQDRRIKALETQINGAMIGSTGSTGSTGTGVTAGSDTAWKIPRNWPRIKTGMSMQQVTAILGRPTKIEKVGHYTKYFYEGQVAGSGYAVGIVTFDDNRVSYRPDVPVF